MAANDRARRLSTWGLLALTVAGLIIAAFPAQLYLPIFPHSLQNLSPGRTVYESDLTKTDLTAQPDIPARFNVELIVALIVFSIGAAIYFFKQLITARLVRNADQEIEPTTLEILRMACESTHLGEVPKLLVSDRVTSPCVVGIVHPVILLPVADSVGPRPEDLRLILCHEATHVKKWDHAKVQLTSLVCCLFWWNPLAHVWQRAIRRRLENEALGFFSTPDRSRYWSIASTYLERPIGSRWTPHPRRTQIGGWIEAHRTALFAWLAPAGFLLSCLKIDFWRVDIPHPSRIGYREVVYLSDKLGQARFFRMDSSGRHQQPLSTLFIGATVPAISPDGTMIAYVRGKDAESQDIYIANIDGTHERRIVATKVRDYLPMWSPDGRQITFSTLASGSWNVGLFDLQSGRWHLLTNDSFVNLESSFHPNGNRIVFSSQRTGVQKLWSMDLDGSNLMQLTYGNWVDTGAKYSRDGRLLVFSSYERWKYEIWVLDLMSGKRRPLPTVASPDCGEANFVWADQSIVYSTRSGLIPQLGRTSIDGRDQSILTRDGQNYWTATR